MNYNMSEVDLQNYADLPHYQQSNRHLKVHTSLPWFWVTAKAVFLYSFKVVSHERKLVATKMIKVIPCEDPCFMQVIEKQSTSITNNTAMSI